MEIYSDAAIFSEMSIGLLGAMEVLYSLFVGVLGIGGYILQSWSFYTIASRRGIKHPWLSWIPIGNLWILGCISDQYQYVVKNKVKNKRKLLMVLSIILIVCYAVVFVLGLGTLISMFGPLLTQNPPAFYDAAWQSFIGSLLGILALSMVMGCIAIAVAVIEYIALYDLYHSCDPANSTLYLLLSIFVGVAMPVVLFLCRNKDLGMPPRKPEPAHIPQDPPAEPWENT